MTETDIGGVVRFSVELPPRGLRTNSRAQNRGWRAALTREYAEAVWIAGYASITKAVREKAREPRAVVVLGNPWEKAHLTLTWKHAGVAPDRDNVIHNCKALIDVLHARSKRPLSLVVDDSPAHLTIEAFTEKVRRRVDECVVVELHELREGDG